MRSASCPANTAYMSVSRSIVSWVTTLILSTSWKRKIVARSALRTTVRTVSAGLPRSAARVAVAASSASRLMGKSSGDLSSNEST
jgi:hypothetical protein